MSKIPSDVQELLDNIERKAHQAISDSVMFVEHMRKINEAGYDIHLAVGIGYRILGGPDPHTSKIDPKLFTSEDFKEPGGAKQPFRQRKIGES